MASKTKYDLLVSAEAAAVKSMNATDNLQVQTLKLAEFAGSGFGEADYDDWESYFNYARKQYSDAAKLQLKSATAAAATAKAS